MAPCYAPRLRHKTGHTWTPWSERQSGLGLISYVPVRLQVHICTIVLMLPRCLQYVQVWLDPRTARVAPTAGKSGGAPLGNKYKYIVVPPGPPLVAGAELCCRSSQLGLHCGGPVMYTAYGVQAARRPLESIRTVPSPKLVLREAGSPPTTTCCCNRQRKEAGGRKALVSERR